MRTCRALLERYVSTTQARDGDGEPSESHPMFRPHLVQGWSPDFIPQLGEDAQQGGLINEVVGIGGADAMRLSRPGLLYVDFCKIGFL